MGHRASELRKLGIDVAKSTVEKYMVRRRKPSSPTWRAFLANHVKELVSLDFFMVPTVRFEVLFVLIILAHHRRRVMHFNITESPTARWTVQQVVEAFPWDTAPRLLLRDRDGVYGADFRQWIQSMGIEEVIIAARSPWQSPYVERMIDSVRRECLDNAVVLGERHLRRSLEDYFAHYHSWRCHRSLEMDRPEPRPVWPPEVGEVARSARPAVCTGTTSERPPEARRPGTPHSPSVRSRGMARIAPQTSSSWAAALDDCAADHWRSRPTVADAGLRLIRLCASVGRRPAAPAGVLGTDSLSRPSLF
jgi:transposase InsO family protein